MKALRLVKPTGIVTIGTLLDVSKWDVSSPLTAQERSALAEFAATQNREDARLRRFIEPLDGVLDALFHGYSKRTLHVEDVLRVVGEMGSYWNWSDRQWNAAARRMASLGAAKSLHLLVLPALFAPSGVAALDPDMVVGLPAKAVAKALFGKRFTSLNQRVADALVGMGYSGKHLSPSNRTTVLAQFLLYARTTDVNANHIDLLVSLADTASNKHRTTHFREIGRALSVLGLFPATDKFDRLYAGVKVLGPPAWESEIAYWEERQLRLSHSNLEHERGRLRSIARWFGYNISHVQSPTDLDYESVVKFRTAVVYGKHGAFSPHLARNSVKAGALAVRTRGGKLQSLRKFIEDLVDLKRLPPTALVLASELRRPKSWARQMSADPRVIEDLVFAKLLTAGLELTREDTAGLSYPFELVRALTFVWLFGGMRRDEIRRLDVACLERRDVPGEEDASIVWLRVPANKYKPEFVKPVQSEIVEAIEDWLAVRPQYQPKIIDPKTGVPTDHLFRVRGKMIGDTYLNKAVIPMLLRKVGLEGYSDRHGHISTHRARSTIVTILGNGPNAMSLVAIRDWLGHRNINTTMSYLATTPVELARQYRNASKGWATVYVDEDAVREGAGDGPWRFTDVADGMCGYAPFASCPNRMACLKSACEHHRPEEDPTVQRLRSGVRAQRLVEEIDLQEVQVKKRRRLSGPSSDTS